MKMTKANYKKMVIVKIIALILLLVFILIAAFTPVNAGTREMYWYLHDDAYRNEIYIETVMPDYSTVYPELTAKTPCWLTVPHDPSDAPDVVTNLDTGETGRATWFKCGGEKYERDNIGYFKGWLYNGRLYAPGERIRFEYDDYGYKTFIAQFSRWHN